MAFTELNISWRPTIIAFLLSLATWSSALKMNFTLDGFQGEIASPNYPNNYPLNISFIWTIKKEHGKILRLTFLDFQIEKAKRCIYDSLQLRDQNTLPWKEVRKYCGKEIPKDFVTREEKVEIKFTSDSYNIVDRGFRISYQVEDEKGRRIYDNCLKEAEPKVKPTICPPAKSVEILKKICHTKYCDCNSRFDGSKGLLKEGAKSHQSRNIVNRISSSGQLSKEKIKSNRLHVDCSRQQKVRCKNKQKDDESESGEKNVAVGIFSVLLVVFVIINVVLMVFLWKRNKELDILKNSSTSYSTTPGMDWVSCGKPAIRIANSHDSTKTVSPSKASTHKPSCPQNMNAPANQCQSLNTMRQYRRREGSPRSYAKLSKIEQQRYFSLLSGIVKTPRNGRTHNGHLNEDESYEETSDIYVSSSYPSPVPSHVADRFAV